MDILLDTKWAVELVVGRDDAAWRKVAAHCAAMGGRVWLYAGAVSDFARGVEAGLQERGVSDAAADARARIKAFTDGKQWLAALAGEGDVFDAEDPSGEQLLRAVARFDGKCVVLTEDRELLSRAGDRAMSSAAYCELPIKGGVPFINLGAQQDKIRGGSGAAVASGAGAWSLYQWPGSGIAGNDVGAVCRG
jgi:UDP-2-acetamido-2-deoxy-ribo-hexuluronate aminotransferase